MYTHGWFTLRFDRKQQNSVKQLSFIKQKQQQQKDYTTKATYRFSAMSIKLPMGFFKKVEQANLKYVWKQKRPHISIAILRKNTRAERIPDFRLYYKAVIKTLYCRHKNRDIGQWNKTESPEINPGT